MTTMTAVEKREAVIEMGLTSLFTVEDPTVATSTQLRVISEYVEWLSDRYVGEIELDLCVVDDETWIVSADADDGRYALHVPRRGLPYVYVGLTWRRKSVHGGRRGFHLSFYEGF